MFVRAPTALERQRILQRIRLDDRRSPGSPLPTYKSSINMNGTLQVFQGTRLRATATLLVLLGVGACASTPPAPTANLQAARQAIATAERADAGRFAAEELNASRTRLVSAESAVTDKKMVVAERLADLSRAGAELATAKTESVKAIAVNEEMKRSTGTLIEEMKRSEADRT